MAVFIGWYTNNILIRTLQLIMPPKTKKERPANLRPKPKKSVKACIARSGSSSASDSEVVASPGHETSPEREVVHQERGDQVGEIQGQGAIDNDTSNQGLGLRELVGEIRSLRDSVEGLRESHKQTERRLKHIEGESRGSKRSRSHDDFSEEESTSRQRRSRSLSPSSSLGSDSQDSVMSRACDQATSFGASIPIDAAVSEKIKKHIYKGKFIEFRYLLDPEERPTKQRKLQLKISAVNSEVHSVAAQEPGPLADFTLWDKAFHVFLAILIKSPTGSASLLDNLLIYRRSIQTMYLAGGDWERYDIKFRSAMAVLPKQLKWQHRQYDLWDDCMRRKVEGKKPAPYNKPNTSQFFPSKSGASSQSGVCNAFQKYNRCSRGADCRYRHVCQLCRSESHGSSRCNTTPRSEPTEKLPPK